jgi:hypothetical protein
MDEQVELLDFDLRYESYRLKSDKSEKALLASILQNNIRMPLEGVDVNGIRILLDGFKRYRCAMKLSIQTVPYNSISEDEAMGIIYFIRKSNTRNLNILEQSRLIDELIKVHKMSYSEIANHLEKSKSWVAMRVGLIDEMSALVKDRVFQGKFPVYSFMYNLRPFIRMNGIKKEEIDQFVDLVSGKGLSIRVISTLLQGYFRGTEEFREQIRSGDIKWALDYLQDFKDTGKSCNESERKFLKDLEIIRGYMCRIMFKTRSKKMGSNSFQAQLNVLSSDLLKQLEKFKVVVEDLYDRSGNP